MDETKSDDRSEILCFNPFASLVLQVLDANTLATSVLQVLGPGITLVSTKIRIFTNKADSCSLTLLCAVQL